MKPVYDHYTEQLAAINPEKPVRCYRNLHTGLWSVKQDRVAFHTNIIYLKNVDFLVNERLRLKVIAERKKNVHAFVRGYVSSPAEYYNTGTSLGAPVMYNPYKFAHFMAYNGPCDTADVCVLERLWNGKMMVYANGIKFHRTSIDSAIG